MAKVTSKLQVTVPKVIALQYEIEPGDEIDFQPAGDVIRLLPKGRSVSRKLTLQQRLQLFDQATERQQARQQVQPRPAPTAERGWSREELYDRSGAG